MPLIKNGSVVADEWTLVGPDEPLPARVPIIVPVARWLGEREVLMASGRRLGVLLESHELPELVADDLSHLEVVALEFPHFKDGRSYSSARELRERYGYTGEVRAVGDVGRDQLMFMHRCGFNAFEVSGSISAGDWQDALSSFSVSYQAGVDGRIPVWRMRRQVMEAH